MNYIAPEVDVPFMNDDSEVTEIAPKAKASIVTLYKVEDSINTINKDRLSPQVAALVESILEASRNEKGEVTRSEVFAAWQEKTKSDSGEKVFASYIHQLISYSFISRTETDKAARKVVTSAEKVSKLAATLSKLSEADKAALLAQLGL